MLCRIAAILLSLTAPATAQETLPDAAKVLDLLAHTAHSATSLTTGFQGLYGKVVVLDVQPAQTPDLHDGRYDRIALDLWQNQQPYAAAQCTTYGPENLDQLRKDFAGARDPFSIAATSALSGPGSRRVLCSFDYWDPEAKVAAFLDQSLHWARANIGPTTPQTDPLALWRLTAVNQAAKPNFGPWAMTMALAADGPEAQATLAVLIELPPR